MWYCDKENVIISERPKAKQATQVSWPWRNNMQSTTSQPGGSLPLERRSPWQCWTAVAVLSVCLLVGAAELLLRTALGCATTLCLTQTSGLKLQPGSPHSLLTRERRHSLVRLASDSCQQGQHWHSVSTEEKCCISETSVTWQWWHDITFFLHNW